jgi:hypothetical protein
MAGCLRDGRGHRRGTQAGSGLTDVPEGGAAAVVGMHLAAGVMPHAAFPALPPRTPCGNANSSANAASGPISAAGVGGAS